jgi:NADPH-dependent curcumin reductase CurA
VGQVVCQIAKLKACRVIGIAGGPEKCRYLRDELKLDAVIDYKQGDIAQQLEQASPDGIDASQSPCPTGYLWCYFSIRT